MRLSFRLKHHFFSAFRELFVHHHGSLEFRAKIFALLIAANEDATVENYILIKRIGLKLYKEDTDRADLLMLSSKEMVKKVKEDNGLNLDSLALNIQKELKIIPRYAKKIDIDALREFLKFTHNNDTLTYQENILEFLENIKNEILNQHKNKG